MKRYQKEIIGSLVVVIAIIGITSYFLHTMQREKDIEDINIYHLLAQNPTTVFSINRPQVFVSQIAGHPAIDSLFASYIPHIYLSLTDQSPAHSIPVVACYPEGIIFVTKTNRKGAKWIEKHILSPTFNTAHPVCRQQGKISFFYYPDSVNHFFGYYHFNGVLVAGNSRKLLEEVADRQIKETTTRTDSLLSITPDFDTNVPVNLAIPAALIDIHIDSLEWKLPQKWFTTDIFASDSSICCHGDIRQVPDSLFQPAAKAFSDKLREFFPALEVNTQIHEEEGKITYTACTPLTTRHI